jgi:hypothetical protein
MKKLIYLQFGGREILSLSLTCALYVLIYRKDEMKARKCGCYDSLSSVLRAPDGGPSSYPT